MDIKHVFIHSAEDTVKMLPFLFLAYLAIEYLEREKSENMERLLAKGGRFGFVPGSLLGLIPQCGFSTMAANFYASRVITLGTLLAVFISTSDEAIPILLANGSYTVLAKLLGFKLAYALLVGFLIDVVFVKWIPKKLHGGYGGSSKYINCHEHDEKDGLLLAALKHTINIYVILFVFTLLFGFIVEAVGEDTISAFMGSMGFFQPIVAVLIGLIPNCASSILLTQLYLSGSISLGSVLAGLCANGGVGLTVLFRANQNQRQNIFIVGLLIFFGSLLGIVVQLIGLS